MNLTYVLDVFQIQKTSNFRFVNISQLLSLGELESSCHLEKISHT